MQTFAPATDWPMPDERRRLAPPAFSQSIRVKMLAIAQGPHLLECYGNNGDTGREVLTPRAAMWCRAHMIDGTLRLSRDSMNSDSGFSVTLDAGATSVGDEDDWPYGATVDYRCLADRTVWRCFKQNWVNPGGADHTIYSGAATIPRPAGECSAIAVLDGETDLRDGSFFVHTVGQEADIIMRAGWAWKISRPESE